MTFQLESFGSIPKKIIKKKEKEKKKRKGEPRLVKIKEVGLGEEGDFSILCCYVEEEKSECF
jgi:hypothetical protein